MPKLLHPALSQKMSDHLRKVGFNDLNGLQALTFKDVWLAHGPADFHKDDHPYMQDWYSLFRAMRELKIKLIDFDPAIQFDALMDTSFMDQNADALGTRTHNALMRVGLQSRVCFELISVDEVIRGVRNFGPKMEAKLTAVLRQQGIIK